MTGASETRTRDLLHAMQALSQLSYGPGGCRTLREFGHAFNRFAGNPSTDVLVRAQPSSKTSSSACITLRLVAIFSAQTSTLKRMVRTPRIAIRLQTIVLTGDGFPNTRRWPLVCTGAKTA